MSATPNVSVVIPTRGRPELVTRAVRSVLAQTVDDLEVIVVIDGPDDLTRSALTAVGDPRLRVIALPESGGAPNARNVGVREARAPWTALLDDDDEWLPDKLAVQLKLAKGARVPMPIVASRLVNRTPRADFVIPRRLPAPGEPLSEYLTVRRGLFHGDGFIQTSTILAPTELLRRVPFTVGLRRLQELDWTLRALHHEDVGLVIAPEPLVVWYQDEDRPRISDGLAWEHQLEWLRRSRPLLTPRAYAALTMSVLASMAAPTRSLTAFRTLLREARRHGRPGPIDYLTFLQIWLIPPQLRRTLRDRVLRRRRGAAESAVRRGVEASAVPATGAATADHDARR
ncbi:glycosyltransferase family 2 protein [Micromonospora sp. HM5-17]|uniref:glycosyltransferase family 2 protein n=1 Tax=Micromonospora sp. HM5-17 TaxID=2487710 RepID=UPI000F465F33|nr:glycosyltransferase family 2 protein [Micromonospora sp. HM5-17]ROT33942.1 glycosyltransferase family 2 protein [Micromonospora sp. HM5-17]